MARSNTARSWAVGGSIFGAVMMVIVGVFQLVEGIAALGTRAFFATAPNYRFRMGLTGWGWIHVVIGAVLILAGLAVLTGSAVARGIGIVVLGLSAISQFFFLPFYPAWSLLIIALDVFVIWSLASVSLGDRMLAPGASTGRRAYESDANTAQRWPAANHPATSTGATYERQTTAPTGEPASGAYQGAHAAQPQSGQASQAGGQRSERGMPPDERQ